MKVLFICSKETDYLQDLLYSGLVKLLGASQVYDFPLNPRYHFIKKKYPRNLGFQGGLTRLWQGLFPFRASNFDLVIVASCKPSTVESYARIMKQIPAHTPILFIDGGDRPEVGGDLLRLNSRFTFEELEKIRPFDLIFKREFFEHHYSQKRLVPFPMAMNLNSLPASLYQTKKYDVSFWAVESDPIRTQALKLLQNNFDCQQNGTSLNQSFHKYKRTGTFYLEELARCKIVFNFRGAGWDTLRYWEAPAVGSFMISQKPGIVIPDNFVDQKHIIFCRDDLSDLIDLGHYYLKNDKLREEIARNSSNHLKQFHTDVHRARTLLNKVQRI
ncbi:glycosyltransferase [bacterium]|nr:glycosyltransferase [bacterium]